MLLSLDPNWHQPRHTYNPHHHPHMIPLRLCHNKPRSGFPNRRDKRNTISWYPRLKSSVSDSTIMDERKCSRSDPMMTEYAAKDAPSVVIFDINTNNSRSQDSRQSTNINKNDMFEAGNDTELLCMWFTLLLKVIPSKNSHNAKRKLLQDFLVQIQQSYRHIAFLLW